MTTVTQSDVRVIGGVDTHRDFHVVAACDQIGTVLGTETFETTTSGYRQLIEWLGSFGTVHAVGVEGTGSWGAGLTRTLTNADIAVLEVTRPNRQARRRHGKSDITDAISAARSVLNGDATGQPRGNEGATEALRVLKLARRSAKKQQIATANQIRALIVTAPEPTRQQLRHLTMTKIVAVATNYRPTDLTNPHHATKHALRTLTQRHRNLTKELTDLDRHIENLVHQIAPPQLLQECGIGPQIAAALLLTAGANPQRLHSDAAFAALCGVSAVDASSGLQQRHRLNRGGDRQANSALHLAIIVRLRYHQPTRQYMTRRLAQGKTRRETIRCLKRHLARQIHKHLTQNTT